MSAPRVLAAAIDDGLVAADSVLGGHVHLEDLSRSNSVHAVLAFGRPVAYCKQSGGATMLDDPLALEREVAALGALSGTGVAPTLLPGCMSGTAWLSAVPGVALCEAAVADCDRDAVSAALGRALARLHTQQTGAGDELAPLPWAADLPSNLPASMREGETSVVLAARSEPWFLRAAEEVRRGWGSGRWIHGDVSAANVLLVHGTDGAFEVRLVDFELAGLGPPEWDIESALDTLSGLFAAGRCADAFLDGYRTAGGVCSPHRAFAAIRALTSAWQVACASAPTDEADAAVAYLLERGRALGTPAAP